MVIRRKIILDLTLEAHFDIPGINPEAEANVFHYYGNGDIGLASRPRTFSFSDDVTLTGETAREFLAKDIRYIKTLEEIHKKLKAHAKELIAKTEYKIYWEAG